VSNPNQKLAYRSLDLEAANNLGSCVGAAEQFYSLTPPGTRRCMQYRQIPNQSRSTGSWLTD